MKTNLNNVLIKIQFVLGLTSAPRLVSNFGDFVTFETAQGRCYSAEVTKRGELKKNSIRTWKD